ncbi:MAG: hypothetical protein JXB13_08330 [Phycisphaerae bacterium]|nr:hypothetical protein [Phycisphaerae bacterium]
MTDSSPHIAESEISRDTPCVTCGYNLRGLPPDGRCPECDTPIDWSLGRYRLCLADTNWLDSLGRGVHFIIWGIVAAIIAVPATITCALVDVWILWIVPVGTGIVWAVLTTRGTWLLTTPEPTSPIPEERHSLRWVIRVCMMLSLAGIVLGVLLGRLGGITGQVLELVVTMLMCTRVIQNLGELVYVRRLARRVPDADLVRSTSRVLWTAIITLGLFFLADALVAGAGTLGNAVLIRGAGILKDVTSFAVLPVALWYTNLLIWYERVFKAAANVNLRIQSQ